MLIITRRRNERLRIGRAVVTVVKVTPSTVTLGVTAPSDVIVLREELLKKAKEADHAVAQ